MAANLEVQIRSPAAYGLAQRALQEMERCKVWPTPLNFELWLSMVAEPGGALHLEVERLLAAGEAITEAISDALAARFLTKQQIDNEIEQAGAQLSKQLDGVSRAIQQAQQTSADYGLTLADATVEIEQGGGGDLKKLVKRLTEATDRVAQQNAALEERLNDSNKRVENLQQNLNLVRRDSMTDALTNLANRKAFDEGLASAVAQADEAGQPLSLCIIDIDHFKRFNDTWGHQTGDQVIRYVASVLGRLGVSPRLAARYGGEEFAVVLPGDPTGAAAAMLDAMRVEIASRALKRRSTNEDLGAVTVSVGVAGYRAGESPISLIERADEALYASKRSGRNRVTDLGCAVYAAA
ncbi:MAG: GGDEF domain-containing protein [Caulobacteraceae bacterium]